jgi:hypothetical protein
VKWFFFVNFVANAVQSRPCRTQPCATAPVARVLVRSNSRRLAGQPKTSPPPLSASSFRAGTSPSVHRPALKTHRPGGAGRSDSEVPAALARWRPEAGSGSGASRAAGPTVRLRVAAQSRMREGPAQHRAAAGVGAGDSGRMPPIRVARGAGTGPGTGIQRLEPAAHRCWLRCRGARSGCERGQPASERTRPRQPPPRWAGRTAPRRRNISAAAQAASA